MNGKEQGLKNNYFFYFFIRKDYIEKCEREWHNVKIKHEIQPMV